jgi:hypothetical protein
MKHAGSEPSPMSPLGLLTSLVLFAWSESRVITFQQQSLNMSPHPVSLRISLRGFPGDHKFSVASR